MAKDRSDVTGDNPFKGHEIYGTHDTEKYQMLEPDELQRLAKAVSSQSLEERLIFLLGLYTGARCGEICKLRVGDVMRKGDYLYYYIDKGKTNAATRNVPIPEHLHGYIETISKDRDEDESLFGLSEKDYGRTFSKLKLKTLGKSKGKAFHSLRVGFITALKRCDVRELHAAEICGHAKRGNTMSYGYYAKENEIKVLAEQCAKAVDYISKNWLNT